MKEIILIILGAFAGAFSGILGIGGGLIMVPALVYIMNMSQHQAQGTTLAVMLPPITLLSAYIYYKAGHIDIKIAIILCVGFFLGSYLGGKIAVMLPGLVLKRIFGVFLLITAINMLLAKK